MKLNKLFENKRVEHIATAMGKKIMAAAHNDVSANNASPEEILQQLLKIDPSNGKMLQYLATRYAAREFRLEDAERVGTALKQFIYKRPNLPKKDINQYKSIHDLYDAVEEAPEAEPSNKAKKKMAKHEGSEVFMQGPNFIVIHLLTGEAACYYAAGTKWCTSNSSTFENYAKDGSIYVIMVKDEKGKTRKFQFHYESGQVMDEVDRSLSQQDIQLLSSYPQWYEFIDTMVKRHHVELDEV